MTEKVLGFYEKDLPKCVFLASTKEGRTLNWVIDEKHNPEIPLVPVVSVEWLKKYCKENWILKEQLVIIVNDLLLAVKKEANKK